MLLPSKRIPSPHQGRENRVLRQLGCIYQKQENKKRINEEQEKETVGDKVSSLSRSRSTR
jgi:hypothetical protein